MKTETFIVSNNLRKNNTNFKQFLHSRLLCSIFNLGKFILLWPNSYVFNDHTGKYQLTSQIHSKRYKVLEILLNIAMLIDTVAAFSLVLKRTILDPSKHYINGFGTIAWCLCLLINLLNKNKCYKYYKMYLDDVNVISRKLNGQGSVKYFTSKSQVDCFAKLSKCLFLGVIVMKLLITELGFPSLNIEKLEKRFPYLTFVPNSETWVKIIFLFYSLSVLVYEWMHYLYFDFLIFSNVLTYIIIITSIKQICKQPTVSLHRNYILDLIIDCIKMVDSMDKAIGIFIPSMIIGKSPNLIQEMTLGSERSTTEAIFNYSTKSSAIIILVIASCIAKPATEIRTELIKGPKECRKLTQKEQIVLDELETNGLAIKGNIFFSLTPGFIAEVVTFAIALVAVVFQSA